MSAEATIRSGTAGAYTVPTDAPEADGTIAWSSTTLIVVELHAANATGIGYTYAHRASVIVARELNLLPIPANPRQSSLGEYDAQSPS